MRAVLPETEPDGRRAGRPRGFPFVLALAAALMLLLGAAPAAADTVVPALGAVSDPRMPQPVLLLNDCDATLSIVDLVPGRTYDITVADTAGSFVFSAIGLIASGEVLDSFVTVPAGVHYWTVTDSAAPSFTASRTVDVAPCVTETAPAPQASGTGAAAASTPVISIALFACDLLGASDISVQVDGLSAGSYRAGVSTNGAVVSGVAEASLTASANTAVFSDLPNGGTYLVWVMDSTGTTVASQSISMPVCDLPTLDTPVDESSELPGVLPDAAAEPSAEPAALATTGLPVASAFIGGLAVFQIGALVAALGLLRLRRPATARRRA